MTNSETRTPTITTKSFSRAENIRSRGTMIKYLKIATLFASLGFATPGCVTHVNIKRITPPSVSKCDSAFNKRKPNVSFETDTKKD